MKYLSFLLLLLATLTVRSQHVFYFDTNNPDDAKIEDIFDTTALTNDVTYNMAVKGNYSIWAPSYWSGPCGNVETGPLFPSPNNNVNTNVGFDFKYMYSLPTTTVCSGKTLPDTTSRIRITLDNGATWIHPTTTDTYNAGHTYNYQVTGQGFPLGVRQGSDLNSDDYGMLEFTLTPLSTGIDATAPVTETVKLYPNPANKVLKISLGKTFEDVTINVFSITGKIILTNQFKNKSSVGMNIETLEDGIYFVHVTVNSKNTVLRFTKQSQ